MPTDQMCDVFSKFLTSKIMNTQLGYQKINKQSNLCILFILPFHCSLSKVHQLGTSKSVNI